MSSRGAEPHDHEPARQPTLTAYAPEPVCPRQRQPQIGDLGKAGGSIDLYQVDTICRDVGACFDQSQNPTHARSPGKKDKDRRIAPGPIPPISGQSPVSPAAIAPSRTTLVIDEVTSFDWSNSVLTLMPGGAAERAILRTLRTPSTTVSVEAPPFLMTPISTERRPSSRTTFCCTNQPSCTWPTSFMYTVCPLIYLIGILLRSERPLSRGSRIHRRRCRAWRGDGSLASPALRSGRGRVRS